MLINTFRNRMTVLALSLAPSRARAYGLVPHALSPRSFLLRPMTRAAAKIFVTIFFAAMHSSCGAPAKSASDVAGIFGESKSLESKLTATCEALRGRSTSPMLKDVTFSPSCSAAGRDAVELNRVSQLYIVGQKDINTNGDESKDYVEARLRTQIWLNRPLVGLAAIVGRLLNENKDYKGGEVKIASPKNGPDLSGLVRTNIEIVEPPKLDITTLSFGMKLKLRVGDPGDYWIDNDVESSGVMLDDVLTLTVKSTAEKTYDQSLLRGFSAFAAIIPHAGDVYVDVDLNIQFNKGTGLESAIKTMLPKILGSALKPMLDSLLTI